MGHKHTKDEILRGAVEDALELGLSQLSFGRVAARLGISDRIVVYYFPTKDDLIGEILLALAVDLQAALAPAFASVTGDHRALVRSAWPKLARPEVDPVFALYFEASGLAAAGREPFASLVPQLIEAWIEWVAGFVDAANRSRRAEAEATIAVIDGLLLVRQLAGPRAANRAARRIVGDPAPPAQ